MLIHQRFFPIFLIFFRKKKLISSFQLSICGLSCFLAYREKTVNNDWIASIAVCQTGTLAISSIYFIYSSLLNLNCVLGQHKIFYASVSRLCVVWHKANEMLSSESNCTDRLSSSMVLASILSSSVRIVRYMYLIYAFVTSFFFMRCLQATGSNALLYL